MREPWNTIGADKLNEMALKHHISAVTPQKAKELKGAWVVVKGEGARITDLQGRTFIDAVGGGTLAVGVGYGREEIAKAMYDQARELHYTAPYLGVAPVTLQLAAKLAEITPGQLSATWFSSGGSEAVESAIKLVRQYFFHIGQRHRYKFIARRHAYHGTTMGALSFTGAPAFSFLRVLSEPGLMAGVSHIPAPYCYRCDFNLKYPACDLACARELEKEIQRQGPDTVAAFIGEPVMGAGGCIVPVKEYWPLIRSICDQYGVLLIADEVITGFGRTGKWFGCHHWDLEPDIMTMAKNLSGCYVPLGATIIKAELAEKIPMFGHVFTFSGHAVACAASLACIDIMEREKLVEHAAEVGAYLLEGLQSLSDHPLVGDVRGLGQIFAVELVKDKKTRQSFNMLEGIGDRVADRVLEQGVFVRTSPSGILELAPVFTITKKDADTIVGALDRSLAEIEKQL